MLFNNYFNDYFDNNLKGQTSKNGIVVACDPHSSKVIDAVVLSRYCNICKGKSDKSKCNCNYYKSTPGSGGMEPEGAKLIFSISEKERGLIYENFLGDRDSSTFKKVRESKQYGDRVIIKKFDCVNHYTKCFTTRYKKMDNVRISKIDPHDKQVTLKGKYGFQKSFITSLKVFMVKAIIENKGNLKKMQDSAWATYFHFCSSKDDNQHHLCPFNSWCSFKTTGKYIPKSKYLPKLMPFLRPIYEELLSDSNLIGCVPGLTTNCNESFNAQIWRRAPKTTYLGRESLEISLYDAIICRNESYVFRSKIFERMSLEPGEHFLALMAELDNQREINRSKQRNGRNRKHKIVGDEDYDGGFY